MNTLSTLLIFTLIALLLTNCDSENILPPTPDMSCDISADLSPEEQAFMDVVFGNEFGNDYSQIRKWREEVKLYVPVSIPHLDEALIQIVAELNALSSSTQIRIVTDSLEANVIVYFGDKPSYVELYEPGAQNFIEENWGLFFISWNSEYEIFRGTICIDIQRERNRACQQHLLREELTQLLGMMNDIPDYSESIFYNQYRCGTSYTDLDEEFIQLFLSNEIQPGMCRGEVVEALF